MKLFKSAKEKLDKKFIRESYKHYLDFNNLDEDRIEAIKKHLSKTEYNKLVVKEFVNWTLSLNEYSKKELKLATKAIDTLGLNKSNIALNAYKNLKECVEINTKSLLLVNNIDGNPSYYKISEIKIYFLKGNWIRFDDSVDLYFGKEYIFAKSLFSGTTRKIPIRQIISARAEGTKIFVELKEQRGLILIYRNPKALEVLVKKIKSKQ